MVTVVKIIEDKLDDLDNTQAATEQRSFGVGKHRYEIDLCPENAERFDRDFGFWVEAARRVGVKKAALETIQPLPEKGRKWWEDPSRPFNRPTGDAFSDARRVVRMWARDNGWPDLRDRGVVPRDAYDAWYDAVWSTLDPPTWDELKRRENAEADAPPASKPPPRRGRPRKTTTRTTR